MDLGQNERSREIKKGPPIAQIGQEIDLTKAYENGKKRTFIFGRSPQKFTPENFKGKNPAYVFFPEKIQEISRSQITLQLSDKEVTVGNPTKDKHIWISVDSKLKEVVPPGGETSLSNDVSTMRNLEMSFARRTFNEPGYSLKTTSVSSEPTKTNALQKLYLKKS